MKYLSFLFVGLLISCTVNGENIPTTVKDQVGFYKDSLDDCFEGVEKDIVWYDDFEENGDTIIYRFDIPCQLGEDYKNRIMPLEYKAVVVNDSLIDILHFWNIFNSWISEFPEPFNHKDLKYWRDIDDSTSFKSIKANNVELMEFFEYGDSEWIEYYSGNVEIEILDGMLLCDSAKWRPKQRVLEVPGFGKLIYLNENKDTTQILMGDNWEFDAYEDSYVVYGIIAEIRE